jgi:hypothetical protein
MAVIGYRNTNNVLSDQLRVDLGTEISLLEPNLMALQRFIQGPEGGAGLPKRVAVNPAFNWFEMGSETRFDTQNGGATSSVTALPVNNVAMWYEHAIGLNTATQEMFRVVATPGGTGAGSITVSRGWGTTAASMNNLDELLLIGVAQPEGDTSRTPTTDNPAKITNYTEIFREPFAMSGTMLSTDNQTSPHDWDLQTKVKGIKHGKDIEYAFLFGAGNLDTSATPGPRRTTKGATRFITTNVTAVGGTMSETTFNTFLRSQARYGGTRRVLFGSAIVVGAINQYAQGKILTNVGGTNYGYDINTYISPFGKTQVVYHRLLEGTKYGGYGISLDMDQITYRYLGGGKGGSRDTHMNTHIEENDRDGRKDEYLSEVGLQFGQERMHGLLTGVTG